MMMYELLPTCPKCSKRLGRTKLEGKLVCKSCNLYFEDKEFDHNKNYIGEYDEKDSTC